MKKDLYPIILRTANQLFITQGFKNTKMKDIADEALIAVGSIYNYFNSKDILYDAIIYELIDSDNFYELTTPIEAIDRNILNKKIKEKFLTVNNQLDSLVSDSTTTLFQIIDFLIDIMSVYGGTFLMIEKNSHVNEILFKLYNDYRSKTFHQLTKYFENKEKINYIRPLTNRYYHVENIMDTISQMIIHRKYDAFIKENRSDVLIKETLYDIFGHAYLVENRYEK